jgi:lactate racemase
MYRIPYSNSSLEFSLPDSRPATVAVSRQIQPIQDVRRAIEQTLASPIGCPPLYQLAKPGDRVCIVFTDVDRPPCAANPARDPCLIITRSMELR